jgi:hypothetical protein
MVAEKLDKKLRENLRDTRNSLFLVDAAAQGGGHFSFQRPLLIVLDRNVDMATPLHHTWTYQVFVPSLCQKPSSVMSVLTLPHKKSILGNQLPVTLVLLFSAACDFASCVCCPSIIVTVLTLW